MVQSLEKFRQYKAVLALYKLMVRYEYDFYENGVLNTIFKRLVSVATVGIENDIKLGLQEVFRKANNRR